MDEWIHYFISLELKAVDSAKADQSGVGVGLEQVVSHLTLGQFA